MHLSEVFKALSDKTRLRILNLLSRQELCVCQVGEVLGMSQPNASKHLHRLRYSGLIVSRKVSQWCFYRINEKFKNKNPGLYEFLVGEWSRDRIFTDDMQKLNDILCKFECCRKLMQECTDEPYE